MTSQFDGSLRLKIDVSMDVLSVSMLWDLFSSFKWWHSELLALDIRCVVTVQRLLLVLAVVVVVVPLLANKDCGQKIDNVGECKLAVLGLNESAFNLHSE